MPDHGRILSLDEIFRDLMVLTEASMITRSEARMQAIQSTIRRQNTAVEEANNRTRLVDQVSLGELFTGIR